MSPMTLNSGLLRSEWEEARAVEESAEAMAVAFWGSSPPGASQQPRFLRESENVSGGFFVSCRGPSQ